MLNDRKDQTLTFSQPDQDHPQLSPEITEAIQKVITRCKEQTKPITKTERIKLIFNKLSNHIKKIFHIPIEINITTTINIKPACWNCASSLSCEYCPYGSASDPDHKMCVCTGSPPDMTSAIKPRTWVCQNYDPLPEEEIISRYENKRWDNTIALERYNALALFQEDEITDQMYR